MATSYGKIEEVKKLLNLGYNIEQIVEITELSNEEIRKLSHEIRKKE